MLRGVPSAHGLCWVDLDFDCYTVCLILPGLRGIWLKWLGSWARWWNAQVKVNPIQVHEQCHPVLCLLWVWAGCGAAWKGISSKLRLRHFRILEWTSNLSCTLCPNAKKAIRKWSTTDIGGAFAYRIFISSQTQSPAKKSPLPSCYLREFTVVLRRSLLGVKFLENGNWVDFSWVCINQKPRDSLLRLIRRTGAKVKNSK